MKQVTEKPMNKFTEIKWNSLQETAESLFFLYYLSFASCYFHFLVLSLKKNRDFNSSTDNKGLVVSSEMGYCFEFCIVPLNSASCCPLGMSIFPLESGSLWSVLWFHIYFLAAPCTLHNDRCLSCWRKKIFLCVYFEISEFRVLLMHMWK